MMAAEAACSAADPNRPDSIHASARAAAAPRIQGLSCASPPKPLVIKDSADWTGFSGKLFQKASVFLQSSAKVGAGFAADRGLGGNQIQY
jgi:hypothetical protein